jgi:hypothetical protein
MHPSGNCFLRSRALTRRYLLSLILCCVSAEVLLAQPLPFDATRLKGAAQDGAGRVWGIGQEAGLFFWADGKWQEEVLTLPGAEKNTASTGERPGPRPVSLEPNGRGDLIVIWSRSGWFTADEDDYWITKIRGETEPASAALRAHLASVNLTFDRAGVGWLTHAGPRIYRIEPDLRVTLAYTISSHQMAGTRFDLYNPVQGALDADGRVFFWGEQRSRELGTLRGLLLPSDEGFTHRPAVEGLPDRGFSVFTVCDEGRAWAALPERDPDAGLYELDLNQLTAKKLPEPEPKAFAHLSEIIPRGEDRYVVSRDSSIWPGSAALWRWRAGKWQKAIAPLDPGRFHDVYRLTRPLLPAPGGLWMGTGGNGLLWVPHAWEQPALIFDWRKGQPLETVHRIFPLSSGEMLMVGFGHGTAYARADDLLKNRLVSPRLVDIWKTEGNLQRDAQGGLWTLSGTAAGERTLGRWDGARWRQYPLPRELQKDDLGYSIGIDSLGRLWVPYRERRWFSDQQKLELKVKVTVFAPTEGSWVIFHSLEEAFTDLIRQDARFRVDLPGQHQPAFGPRGTICFLGMDWIQRDNFVHFYDGECWRRWDLPTVGIARPGSIGQPFFTSSGNLAINVIRSNQRPPGLGTQEFTGQKWVSVPYESAGIRDPIKCWKAMGGMPGAGMPAQSRDARVGVWKAQHQQLFQSGAGVTAPQFEVAHVHPFIGARQVDQIWMDAKGNIVLRTSLPAGNLSGARQYVVLAPKESMRNTRLDLVKLDARGAELQFNPAPTEAFAEASFTAVELLDDQIILRWSGGGILQSAEQLEGPWTDLPGADSPRAIPLSKPAEFYRIRR